MKNKFIAMLVGIFLIPIACRTETDYVDKEEARQPFAVFSTTSNNNVAYRKNSKTGSDQIDYASVLLICYKGMIAYITRTTLD